MHLNHLDAHAVIACLVSLAQKSVDAQKTELRRNYINKGMEDPLKIFEDEKDCAKPHFFSDEELTRMIFN